MPPEGHFPGAPSDWLRYAFSDLELARLGQQPNVLLEGLCFHAQQAAEKALKAVPISKAIAPPKTHNIRILLDLLPQDVAPPPEVEDAASLTDYAVIGRYPGDLEAIDEEEYRQTIQLAQTVVLWAQGIIRQQKK